MVLYQNTKGKARVLVHQRSYFFSFKIERYFNTSINKVLSMKGLLQLKRNSFYGFKKMCLARFVVLNLMKITLNI